MLDRAPAVVSTPRRASTIEADTVLAFAGTTAAIAYRARSRITALAAHPVAHLIDHAALTVRALVMPESWVTTPTTTTDAVKVTTGAALAV